MIIQAGFDFEILARPFIVQDGKLVPNLVLICVDAEMRLDSVDVIAEDFSGSLAPFLDAVLVALDPEYTRYFAIAHPGRFSEYDFSEPIMDEARILASKAADRGMQLIGHFAIDETGYRSARARSYFDQYPSHEDLPRTMFHWSHSSLGKCG
ncbi:hypothetical protein E5206_04765 [Arthrobacter sp. PAMC25564]|uniref:hypothetical protein n=1 Tax=Arthrobacter sp. PAMC25564 TaxID=2565366 RepID=UPI0010A2357F|nr:hypothetical protein [Arthrobacter sp. PAMC25564]QCB96324.1 hypothetical protein E5206_04765 [Arthrobacter sp. PAMC25564]